MVNTISFPQADDFSKIVSLLNISNEDYLNYNTKLKIVLNNISDRQIAYYISAARFLGIIEIRDGRKVFSEEAIKIREMNSIMQAELMSIILRKPVFSKVYVYTQLFGRQDIDEIRSIIEEFYPNYSDAICKRRAQTVMSWIEWIIHQLNKGE